MCPREIILLYRPTQIRLENDSEESMSHVIYQKSLTPKGNNNLNFRLARDQVVLLEIAANLWASRLYSWEV